MLNSEKSQEFHTSVSNHDPVNDPAKVWEERELAFKAYNRSIVKVSFSIAAFFAIVFVAVFTPIGEYVGLKDGWVAPSPTTGTPVAHEDNVVAATRNLITVLSPMVIGLVLWILGNVGLNRFRQFDDSLENIRNSLEGKLSEFRTLNSQRHEAAQKAALDNERTAREVLDGRFDAFRREILEANKVSGELMREDMSRVVRERVSGEVSLQKKEIRDFFNDIEAKIEKATESIESIRDGLMNRFGHIADHTTYAETVSGFGPLSSVGAVNDKVTELFARGRRGEAITLVKELLYQFNTARKADRPAGSLKGDWFNLSAELGRRDEYGLALDVTLAGLEQQNGSSICNEEGAIKWSNKSVQPDQDVLAHAIQYANVIGDSRIPELIELSDYDPMQKRGAKNWGWRMYHFVINALEGLGRSEEAVALGKNFLNETTLNNDTGKVVETVISVMYKSGQTKEAIDFGKNWLNENPHASGGQIVTTLLDWTDADPDLDEYIALASRGIRDHAEEQQSTSIANLFFRRALARDKKAVTAINSQDALGVSVNNVCQEIKRALEDYRMAASLDLNPGLRPQVDRREKVLKFYSQELGCDLPPDLNSSSSPNNDSPSPSSLQAGETSHFSTDADSGESNEEYAKAVLLSVLGAITTGGDAEEVAQHINDILRGEADIIRRSVLHFLEQSRMDKDFPDQMRAAITDMWPHLET